jgi:dipeptidyl aminopeptidase/acylaminoacyl peptidase
MTRFRFVGAVAVMLLMGGRPSGHLLAQQSYSVDNVATFPFPTELITAPTGQRIAWVWNDHGARNVWAAEGPTWQPRQLTAFTQDDGMDATQLAFTPDGQQVVFVRGGDHGSNWASPGGIEPNPTSGIRRTAIEIWVTGWAGGATRKLAEGDEPAISPRGDRVAFIKGGQVWSVSLAPDAKPQELFFARGTSGDLAWAPDGSALGFVSERGGYSLLGLYTGPEAPIRWLAPSTDRVGTIRWSPNGSRIAFVSRPGRGGPPQTMLDNHPMPWSIRIVEAKSGTARTVWSSPNTLLGSFPITQGSTNLAWAAGDRLIFMANLDGWPHLYSVNETGGQPLLLTPGKFMVEFVTLSPDRRTIVYNANTGPEVADDDRRHLFKVPVDAARPTQLTTGTDLEWGPAVTGDGQTIALLTSGPRRPPLPALIPMAGGRPRLLGADRIPAEFPAAALVDPERVVIPSIDATPVHIQIFKSSSSGPAKRPGLIYVHGGPPRQMLLGFHYWHYYASDYALNQYFASRGFVVASVNYRLGIGYGDAFRRPEHAGRRGASEYQDVVAAAKYLASRPDVDPSRIGIYGGSYGGYLTALALARNSDLFSAGVDIHGVHDRTVDGDLQSAILRYEKPADLTRALEVAWQSSPVADIASWRSPVLLIHGDDDRNVRVTQTVDLVQRLRAQGVRYEEMLIPDEIHDFLRHATWLKVGRATTEFLERELGTRATGGGK